MTARVAGNHRDIVEYLIERDAAFTGSESDSSGFGFNTLHRAAMYGAIDVMKLLIGTIYPTSGSVGDVLSLLL